MSADLWIDRPACQTCGRGESDNVDADSLNITYNLSGMLRKAGFNGWRWCEGKSANVVGWHMLAVLDDMAHNPYKWRGMNPENGWGDYDECLQGRMRAWAYRAIACAPDATVGAWL